MSLEESVKENDVFHTVLVFYVMPRELSYAFLAHNYAMLML